MTSYRLNPAAFREELLNADWMVEEMRIRAADGKQFAEAIAPVDEHGPHPGRYKESFDVEYGRDGGLHHDRAYATLLNDSPEAPYVEFGNGREHTAQHVLLRAMDVMGA